MVGKLLGEMNGQVLHQRVLERSIPLSRPTGQIGKARRPVVELRRATLDSVRDTHRAEMYYLALIGPENQEHPTKMPLVSLSSNSYQT